MVASTSGWTADEPVVIGDVAMPSRGLFAIAGAQARIPDMAEYQRLRRELAADFQGRDRVLCYQR